MIENYESIFKYIQAQEVSYEKEINVYANWSWGIKEHIQNTLFYLFGRLMTGNDPEKPVKNIVRRILKFRYAAEDIDVKNINLYADDPDKFHLSFLIKKYHDEVYIRENKLDKFFDIVKKEKINFGGALVQRVNGRPIKVPLHTLVFCDQSNIMGSPFGIRMPMNPQELLEMRDKGGWGKESNGANMTVEELITLAEYQRSNDNEDTKPAQTPGKYVDIYQVWGMLPAEFAGGKEGEFTLQLHFITFLKKDNDKNNDIGVSLFSMEDKDKERFKFIKQDDGDGLESRALGFGGVEELFEAQAWTNSSMIWKMDMLRAASKMIMQTADSALVARHPSGLKDLDNLEVIEYEEGKPLTQVDTFPRNIALADKSLNEWEEYAQNVSFATNPLLGEEPNAGTPFKLQNQLVVQGKMPHEENVKEFARFIAEIYEDWIIPDIAKALSKGTKFLSELNSDEMEYVSNSLVRNVANNFIKEKILNGELVAPEEVEMIKQQTKDNFMRSNKKFIEILKDELKGVTLKVHVSVANKNKDLAAITDKLSNVFRQVFANPQVLQDPNMARLFQKILEYSGFAPFEFTNTGNQQQQLVQPQIPQQQISQVVTA